MTHATIPGGRRGALAGTCGGPERGTRRPCEAAVEEIDGVNTRSFRGSAKAQATAGGQALSWATAECYADGTHAGVNIGQVFLGTDDAAKARKQFGVMVEAAVDGTYTG